MNEHPIKVARERAGLSAYRLSQILNKSTSYVRHLETGLTVEPTFSVGVKLCRLLKLPVKELYAFYARSKHASAAKRSQNRNRRKVRSK